MERNSQIKFDVAAKVKQILPARQTKTPPARRYHSLVSNEGNLYLFGGLGHNNTALNDLWHFNGENWKQVKIKGAPTPRHSHQAVIMHGKMFVYGGVQQDKTTSNELYCFDFENKAWELVKKIHVSRSGHSMVALDDKIIVFGGADERKNVDNSFIIIDAKAPFSTVRCDCNNPLKPRQYASMIVLDGLIYIYGGVASEPLGDFYRVRVGSVGSRVTVEQLSLPSFIPALKGASLSISPLNNTHLMLFGGLSNTSQKNFIFDYSAVSAEWLEISDLLKSNNFLPRLHHQTCTIGRVMYVFGGVSAETKDELNDMWIFGDSFGIDGGQISVQVLPNEIWTLIFQCLEGEDLAAVAITTKSFTDLIKSDEKLLQCIKEWTSLRKIKVPPINKEIFAVVVGDVGVGKSASVVQFVNGIFVERYDPTIEDSYRIAINIKEKEYIAEILDTANVLDTGFGITYLAIRNQYVAKCHGVYAIYDITRPETLKSLDEDLKIINEVKRSKYPLIIVGNKTDLKDNRKVSEKEGQEFAKRRGAMWCETTAKTRSEILESFNKLFECVVELEEKQRNKESQSDQAKHSKKDRCSVM